MNREALERFYADPVKFTREGIERERKKEYDRSLEGQNERLRRENADLREKYQQVKQQYEELLDRVGPLGEHLEPGTKKRGRSVEDEQIGLKRPRHGVEEEKDSIEGTNLFSADSTSTTGHRAASQQRAMVQALRSDLAASSTHPIAPASHIPLPPVSLTIKLVTDRCDPDGPLAFDDVPVPNSIKTRVDELIQQVQTQGDRPGGTRTYHSTVACGWGAFKQKKSFWVLGAELRFACRTCFNLQRACVIVERDEENGDSDGDVFNVLPLSPSVRPRRAMPGQTDYYIRQDDKPTSADMKSQVWSTEPFRLKPQDKAEMWLEKYGRPNVVPRQV